MNDKLIKAAGACLAVLLILLITTQPAELSALFLMVPFLLLFSCLLLLWYGVLRWRGTEKGRSLRLSLLLSGVPISLLALQSVGQLSWRDTVTILILFGVAYVYMSRIAGSQAKH